MADTSTFPGTLDGDLKALVPTVTPSGASDFLKLLADAVAKMQTELGTDPAGAEATVAALLADIVSDATALDSRVTTNEGDITTLQGASGGGGGRSGYETINPTSGTADVSASTKATIGMSWGGAGTGTIVLPRRTESGMFVISSSGFAGASYTFQDPDGAVTVASGNGGIFTSGLCLFVPGGAEWYQYPLEHWTTPSDLAAYLTTAAAGATYATAAQLAAVRETITASYKTDDYTLALGDEGRVIEMDAATAKIVTVPPNASVAFGVGTVIEVVQLGVGGVEVAAGSGVTLLSPGSALDIDARYGAAVLRKRDTDTWVVGGNLS